MSAAVTMERIAEASPRLKARIAGVFYLLNILTGILAQAFVLGRLVVNGDAGVTAANILSHQPLYRLGLASALLCVASYIAVTALFFNLFEPVNRSISLLAAFFSLAACTIQAFICLFLLAPLAVLGGAPYLSIFKVEQLRALALMFLGFYDQGFGIAMVFFGFYCLLIGYLIFRSNFLPRILGMLMAMAGLCWLTFLSRPLADYVSPYILGLGIIGEGSLMLWLIVMGINAERWKKQATAAG